MRNKAITCNPYGSTHTHTHTHTCSKRLINSKKNIKTHILYNCFCDITKSIE